MSRGSPLSEHAVSDFTDAVFATGPPIVAEMYSAFERELLFFANYQSCGLMSNAVDAARLSAAHVGLH